MLIFCRSTNCCSSNGCPPQFVNFNKIYLVWVFSVAWQKHRQHVQLGLLLVSSNYVPAVMLRMSHHVITAGLSGECYL